MSGLVRLNGRWVGRAKTAVHHENSREAVYRSILLARKVYRDGFVVKAIGYGPIATFPSPEAAMQAITDGIRKANTRMANPESKEAERLRRQLRREEKRS